MKKQGIVALVASALAIALIATPAYAQRGGRGGGRGYGGGGYGGGGWGGGAYHSGYGGYGGYGGNYYHGGYGGYGGGYNRGWGYGLNGIGIGLGLGYSGYGYGYPSYYGNTYYGNSYVNGGYPTYYGDSSVYTGGYDASQGYVTQPMTSGMSNYQVQDPNVQVAAGTYPTGAMQSFYSGPSSSAGKSELTVKVPANAQLWLGSMQSDQQGTERHFSFPALPEGDNLFTLRSTWTENGQPVTRDRQVNIKAGQNSTVDFNQAGNDRSQTNTPTDTNSAPGSNHNGTLNNNNGTTNHNGTLNNNNGTTNNNSTTNGNKGTTNNNNGIPNNTQSSPPLPPTGVPKK